MWISDILAHPSAATSAAVLLTMSIAHKYISSDSIIVAVGTAAVTAAVTTAACITSDVSPTVKAITTTVVGTIGLGMFYTLL